MVTLPSFLNIITWITLLPLSAYPFPTAIFSSAANLPRSIVLMVICFLCYSFLLTCRSFRLFSSHTVTLNIRGKTQRVWLVPFWCLLSSCALEGLKWPLHSQISESPSMLKIPPSPCTRAHTLMHTSPSQFVSTYVGKVLEKTTAKSSGFGSLASFFTSGQTDGSHTCSCFLMLLNTFIKCYLIKLERERKLKCRPAAWCD